MQKNNSLDIAFMAGIAGSKAMFVNVTSLMWLNTTTSIQYCKGGHMFTTLRNTYRQGGLLRFYNGFAPALLHGCISRFGDIYSHEVTKNNSQLTLSSTITSAAISSTIRTIITPLDTLKVFQQMNGTNKFKHNFLSWNASGAVFTSNFVGFIPWFYTHDLLQSYIPNCDHYKNLRNAVIGFTSSIVSDTFSNGFRVLKTLKQCDDNNISYIRLIKNNKPSQLLFRGIETRIVTNAIQSMLFTVMWKYFEETN